MRERGSYLWFWFGLIIVPVLSLDAQTVFLKNGKILQGEITKKEADSITLIHEGVSRVLPMGDILRIRYDTFKSDKVYIHKKDGSVLHAYVVAENASSHTIRFALESVQEVKIPREDVEIISKKNLAVAKNRFLGIHYGYAAPTGDMADILQTGLVNLAIVYNQPFFNRIDIDLRLSGGVSNWEGVGGPLENPTLLVVPALAGLEYKFPMGPAFHLFAELSGGISFVNLSEDREGNFGSYATLQTGLGARYKITKIIAIYMLAQYTYIQQEKQSFPLGSLSLGVGHYF